MHSTSYVAAVVGAVVTLLLVATVTRAVTRYLKLPFTVVLVLIGIAMATLSRSYPHVLGVPRDLELSSALIFYVFLPTLTFQAAFNLERASLSQEERSMTIARPGGRGRFGGHGPSDDSPGGPEAISRSVRPATFSPLLFIGRRR